MKGGNLKVKFPTKFAWCSHQMKAFPLGWFLLYDSQHCYGLSNCMEQSPC